MGGAVSSPSLDDLARSIRQIDGVHKQKLDADPEHGAFVGRDAEMTQLVRALATEPSRVTLLIGPKHSGKSMLLRHLKQQWQSSDQIHQVFAPFLLINLQECLITNASNERDYNSCAAVGLYSAIQDEVKAWADLATASLTSDHATHRDGESQTSIKVGLERFTQSFHMRGCNLMLTLLDWLQTSLKEHPRVWPVIVFDEAHVLKSWCRFTKLNDEVEKLAQFCRWLCEDRGRGHVVMASSDPFFWSWLSESLGITPLKTIAVGHLGEADAKDFVINHLLPKMEEGVSPEEGFDEDVWKTVYGVTGGCLRFLKMVVTDAGELGSWMDATTSLVSTMEEDLRGKVLEYITYREVRHVEGIIGAIVEGGGLAGFNEVIEHVFAGDESLGRREIRHLAEKSMLHVRLWTSSMRYEDVGHKKGDDTLYVTAVHPASFAAMKQLYPRWFATLKKQVEEKTGRGSGREWVDNNGAADYSRRGGDPQNDESGGEWDWDYE